MEETCKNIRELIPDLINRTLPPEKIAELKQHIIRCPVCISYLRALQADDKLLKNFAQSLQPVLVRLENSVINTLAQTTSVKPAKSVSIWRTIMKSPITKLAAAACVIAAVFIGIHRFNVKVDGASTAWASVMQNVHQAATVAFEQTIDIGGRKRTFKKMVNKSGVMRTEWDNGKVQIFDWPNGIEVWLDPNSKRASITHHLGSSMQGKPFNLLRDLTICRNKGKFAGKQEIDGKPADMFVVEEPFFKITIWIDVATCLPVRFENVAIPNPNKDIIVPHMSLNFKDFGGDTNDIRDIGMGGGMGIIEQPYTITQSSFQWNIELDESLFDLAPPPGYTVDEHQSDVSGIEGDKNYLPDALAFWTEMSDGLFPDAINDLGDPNKVRPLLIKKFYKGVSPKEEFDSAYKQMEILLQGLLRVQEQKAYGTWCYAGQGVKVGDVNTPVCWWKPEKSKLWRVLYADFSVDDVNRAELAELEAQIPTKMLHDIKLPRLITDFIGRQTDKWHLDAAGNVTAHCFLTVQIAPADAGKMPIILPYAAGKLQSVKIGETNLQFNDLGNGRYELLLPKELKSFTEKTIKAVWTIPLNLLEQDSSGICFRVELRGLIPLHAYSLRLVLEDNCGYEYIEDATLRMVNPFNWNNPERARAYFGSVRPKLRKSE